MPYVINRWIAFEWLFPLIVSNILQSRPSYPPNIRITIKQMVTANVNVHKAHISNSISKSFKIIPFVDLMLEIIDFME
jgi:hypothetical protein